MKVLVVEDDPALSDVLAFTLRRAGFQVIAVYDGLTALDACRLDTPDLMILDLNLPGLDGLGVLQNVRSKTDMPIIILSVRAGDEAVVNGLEIGADDYIVKPFSPNQLVARVRAVLRRVGVTALPSLLEAGGLMLDRSRNRLMRHGVPALHLTPLEVRLLEQLMLHPGQVLPTDALITAIWGVNSGEKATLKQLVYRLRAKIEGDSGVEALIETVPGIGYALRV